MGHSGLKKNITVMSLSQVPRLACDIDDEMGIYVICEWNSLELKARWNDRVKTCQTGGSFRPLCVNIATKALDSYIFMPLSLQVYWKLHLKVDKMGVR